MVDRAILFLQRRPHRTGAQVALFRLLAHPDLRGLNLVLLVSEHGWLTDEVERIGIPTIIKEFPSSRSIGGRLMGNRRFAASVLAHIGSYNLDPALVVANDHGEGLIAAELAGQAGCRSTMILRSSGMSERDFFKYRCNHFDLIYAAGDELTRKVSRWSPDRHATTFYDGVEQAQFRVVKAKLAKFPREILVVGSTTHTKGWQDVAAAIDILECDDEFPALTLDFTSSPEEAVRSGIFPDRKRQTHFRFIGRETDFTALVRRYDLVVHPSRNESVGLAMLETVAAGVHLLCSRVGVINKVGKSNDWLFRPGDPQDLAGKLNYLLRQWPAVTSDAISAQASVRALFLADDTLRTLTNGLRLGMSAPAAADVDKIVSV